MKKKIILIMMLYSTIALSAEIISWKGMENGLTPTPKWIENYIKNGDEKLIRKKFEINQKNTIIIGKGKAKTLSQAKINAQTDFYKKIKSKLSDKKCTTNYIYEYWEQDEISNYTVYTIYEIIQVKK